MNTDDDAPSGSSGEKSGPSLFINEEQKRRFFEQVETVGAASFTARP